MTWSKDGSTNLPDGVTARSDGYLRIVGQSADVAGQYTLDVTGGRGRSSSPITVRWVGACKSFSLALSVERVHDRNARGSLYLCSKALETNATKTNKKDLDILTPRLS